MVEGCLDGMRELMYEYSVSEEDNSENNQKLYLALKHFLDKQFIEERDKGVPRGKPMFVIVIMKFLPCFTKIPFLIPCEMYT
jgi:hypothetical protein